MFVVSMDIISRAIEKKRHIYENIQLPEQTWELFNMRKADKRVFVFGTGGGLEYLLRNYGNCLEIEGVIDNDVNKQNRELGWYCGEAWQTKHENILIQNPAILNDYDKEDILVLITSINFYIPMIAQLQQMGINDYFVLLLLEAGKRKSLSDHHISENPAEVESRYIDWCCKQKIEKKKIIMRIGEYGGHAREITKQLLQRRKDLDIIWLVHDHMSELPVGVCQIYEKNWKRYIYEMETAKIWLYDANVPGNIQKRRGQIYIQLKHWSSITLKKFYLDDKSSCTSAEIENTIRNDGARMDYLFSGSELDEESCRSGFAFKGEAVRLGSARSDLLFDIAIRKKVRDKFHLKEKDSIVLYVPTYRKKDLLNNQKMSVFLDFEELIYTLHEKFGDRWVLFIRLHPWLSFEKSGLVERENIINAGNYPDSEELVAASDVMITDYSSIMFEAAFVKKPVFLYAPDRNKYIEEERELLLDYNTLPFPRAESNEELARCILDFDRQKYERDVTDFLDKYGVHEDGHASERAAEFILNLLAETGGK